MGRDEALEKARPRGKESVLADSGREGEIPAGIGRVRRAAFSAFCKHNCLEPHCGIAYITEFRDL
jgi:hypothetical protein